MPEKLLPVTLGDDEMIVEIRRPHTSRRL